MQRFFDTNLFIGFLYVTIMEEDKRLKMAIISGAAHALTFKEENPKASEEEVIRHVTKEVRNILEKIDKEL